MRRLSAMAAILLLSVTAFAGGPAFVAGSSYFDPTVKGTPVVWSQGVVNYYTDQGNLSPILSGAAADTFVYRYTARVFYGDQISPARASVAGSTPVTISGLGLQRNSAVQTANINLPVLAVSATQLLVDTPPARDGLYDVLLSDMRSMGSSTMSSVLTIGAGPSDTIKLISGGGSATPVGGQVNTPFTVAVVAS